jgi:preprotein translocase subunit SecD
MYGIVALGGATDKKSDPSVWKPLLGLDLQGGTRVTLTAAGKTPSQTKLKEAASIISKRVNGSGITEATVTTQGNKNIVVEVPGPSKSNLVDSVKRTALLRFRLTAASAGPPAAVTPTPSATATPSSSPTATPTKKATKKATVGQTTPTATPKPRPAPQFDVRAATPKPTPKKTPSKAPSAAATTTPPATSSPSINDPLAWSQNPDQASLLAFTKYVCPAKGKSAAPVDDNPNKPLVTCDSDGNKFLLSKAMIEGTELKSASSGVDPQSLASYAVDLTFKSSARKTFATVTSALAGTNRTFAIVLDGKVLSTPTVTSAIVNGDAQITGGFTQASAASLANSLKFGALPIKFTDPTVDTIGPSLAGDQLSAGLLAGVVGLLIVMLYCLLYYRGLGLVVVASLLVAGGTTYGAVLILGKSAGFTLSLPGIAGLIVAVGITADSFIVYFERIRDEMRAGKSMRVAVESGWIRARNTCLAADTVSLLASVVLYIFAIDEVRGFAFALGISTLIDLAVFFWFTKPMVTLAAKRTFFNSGHRFSGLSAETLGIDLGHHSSQSSQIVGGRA